MDILNNHAKVKMKYIRANNAPFMTRSLTKAIMNRSRLKNRFSKNPNKENELRYKKQRNYCVNLLKREKKLYFSSLNIDSISNSKKFWKTIKPYFSEKTIINKKIILVDEENIISNDGQVADIMNDYFSNVVSYLDIQGYTNNSYTRNVELNEILNAVNKFQKHPSIIKIKENIHVTEPFFFTIPNILETRIEIDKLNKNKPTTENNIPSKILKENSDTCAPFLTKIYSDSVNQGKFPLALKNADITPGHKKGETTIKGNYRPVSILPTVSKLFERNMYRDIDTYMTKYMSPYVCGFRKGYSTQHCLMAMLNKWLKALDKHDNVAAILTDLSKAFDCLNHELLIAKLDAYGFSNSALTLVYSYLNNRFQRTKVNNTYSDWSCINTGIPQGSILGPLLFNIYINDILYFIQEDKIVNYADDNTTYEINKHLNEVISQLEKNTLILSSWFSNNYFKMNADKCHLLVAKHIDDVTMTIGDDVISGEKSVKLLGIIIDNKLDFNEHVTSLCKKASQKLQALSRIAYFIETNNRRIIMKAFIESQFNYCPLIWMFHSRKLNNKINRIHERGLRVAYGDYSSTFEDLLKQDESFTIHEKNLQRLVTEMYKTKNNLAPTFMKNVFQDSCNDINLRCKPSFNTCNVRSVHYGTETIYFRGPQMWELVPDNIKNLKTLSEFKTAIRKWKPVGCKCRLCKTFVKHLGFIN